MMRYVFIVFLLACSLYAVPSRADDYATASSKCSAALSGALWYNAYGHYQLNDGSPGFANPHCVVVFSGGQNQFQILSQNKLNGNGADFYYGGWPFTGSIPPPRICTAGQSVSTGTHYTQSSVTGRSCTADANACEMAFNLGGPDGGSFSLTGSQCPVEGDPDKGPVPLASDTKNPDGGHTYCDPINKVCVTTHPGDGSDGPPASSSSSATGTTANSQTDTPASSSSSTTTGSGDGSGTGTGSGSGTGISTTKTDNPASSSSTKTECTTGVCDVGNADGNIGSLYTPSSDTPASVYGSFISSVSSSPIMSAASGFFAVNASGSCPTWHIPGNKYWGESGFSFDFFCQSAMLLLLQLGGYLVLAVGAFSAFSIALY